MVDQRKSSMNSKKENHNLDTNSANNVMDVARTNTFVQNENGTKTNSEENISEGFPSSIELVPCSSKIYDIGEIIKSRQNGEKSGQLDSGSNNLNKKLRQDYITRMENYIKEFNKAEDEEERRKKNADSSNENLIHSGSSEEDNVRRNDRIRRVLSWNFDETKKFQTSNAPTTDQDERTDVSIQKPDLISTLSNDILLEKAVGTARAKFRQFFADFDMKTDTFKTPQEQQNIIESTSRIHEKKATLQTSQVIDFLEYSRRCRQIRSRRNINQDTQKKSPVKQHFDINGSCLRTRKRDTVDTQGLKSLLSGLRGLFSKVMKITDDLISFETADLNSSDTDTSFTEITEHHEDDSNDEEIVWHTMLSPSPTKSNSYLYGAEFAKKQQFSSPTSIASSQNLNKYLYKEFSTPSTRVRSYNNDYYKICFDVDISGIDEFSDNSGMEPNEYEVGSRTQKSHSHQRDSLIYDYYEVNQMSHEHHIENSVDVDDQDTSNSEAVIQSDQEEKYESIDNNTDTSSLQVCSQEFQDISYSDLLSVDNGKSTNGFRRRSGENIASNRAKVCICGAIVGHGGPKMNDTYDTSPCAKEEEKEKLQCSPSEYDEKYTPHRTFKNKESTFLYFDEKQKVNELVVKCQMDSMTTDLEDIGSYEDFEKSLLSDERRSSEPN